MIITSVEFEPCVMPLEDKSWTFALGTASTSRGYVVRLTSDSGHVGYGYSNSSPHMGSTFESLPAELERFKPHVLGKDPFAIEAILMALNRSLTGASQAKAGIDCALHDLCARSLGIPNLKFFGEVGYGGGSGCAAVFHAAMAVALRRAGPAVVASGGTVILSLENGISQLSFVSADSILSPRVYHAINGTDLPVGATQLIPLADKYVLPGTISSYWVICSDPDNPGVQLDAATFLPIKGLKENFFSPPPTVVPGTFQGNDLGVLLGVANGKLYAGSTYTWNLSPTYGMFGLPATGDYYLHRQAAFNATFPYMLGYDSMRQSVIGFTNFGNAAYIGTTYQVTDTTAFNPKRVGLKLLDFEQINDQNVYAFGRAANDSIYEVKFGAAFIGVIQLSPAYKRPFPHPELITPQTLWGSSPGEVFYFSSGSSIYRYNPLNQDLQPLATDFGGKAVTMLRMTNQGNTIIAGVDGSVFFLDVSTGRNGNITRRIDDIPGSPVDVTVRTQ